MAKRPTLGSADYRVLRKVIAGHPLIYTEVPKPRGGVTRVYEMAGENQARARAEALERERLIEWSITDGIGRARATKSGVERSGSA